MAQISAEPLALTTGLYGVVFQASATGVMVGGTLTGQGNTIANNSAAGISFFSSAGSSNALRRNLIYDNGGLGIDFNNDGVTLNDPGDGDGITPAEPNEWMNFPVIYNVVFSGPNVIITGEARPGATVEFFRAALDGDTHGEADYYIGSGVVGVVANGIDDPTAVQFSFSFAIGPLVDTDLITATATDSSNNTSEFAENVNINNAPVLDNSGTMTLDPITEDISGPANTGTTVADIIQSGGIDMITDPDSGAVEGIAVTGVDNTNGTWEYTTDGSTWYSFAARGVSTGVPSDADAVLLDSIAQIRFVPNADYSGAGGDITFRPRDQTTGANGDFNVDVSGNGVTRHSAELRKQRQLL